MNRLVTHRVCSVSLRDSMPGPIRDEEECICVDQAACKDCGFLNNQYFQCNFEPLNAGS